ncbi:MAG: YfhO family protein, partial [Chryseotalea sp.]
INMLNAKYLVYGPGAENILVNNSAYGPAWFVKEIKKVKSADEELSAINTTDLSTTAIIDESKFTVDNFQYDSLATVQLQDYSPKKLVYEVETTQNGLVVFSEIYYPEGWKAFIDGKEVNILRANYILRALDVPAGKHKIEFRFEPTSYHIGNSVTAASSWIVLLFLIGCIVLEIRKKNVG